MFPGDSLAKSQVREQFSCHTGGGTQPSSVQCPPFVAVCSPRVGVRGRLALPSVSRGAAVNGHLLPLSKGLGTKWTLPTEGHLLKPKCTWPVAYFPRYRTGNNAKWLKHHSIQLRLGLAFHFGNLPNGSDEAAGPSLQ